MRAWLVVMLSMGLAACVSVGIGTDAPLQAQYRLHDAAPPPAHRAEPLVPALLIQALPADATADSVAIAYSRRANEFAYYQLAAWTRSKSTQPISAR